MRRLIVVAFAALCVIGTSSLALAEDAMDGKLYGDQREPGKSSGEGARYADQREPGKSSGEGARYADQIEPARADDSMKGKTKEHKEKMKAHKDAANAAPAVPAPAAKP